MVGDGTGQQPIEAESESDEGDEDEKHAVDFAAKSEDQPLELISTAGSLMRLVDHIKVIAQILKRAKPGGYQKLERLQR
jgi:hypothetical protein